MEGVESTSVIRVLMYDRCKHVVLFGGQRETLWSSPRIEFDQPGSGPLPLPEYREF